jgi:hypothetical protein
MISRSTAALSETVQLDIQKDDIQQPHDFNFFVSGPERMKMIPSPAQAMTILRALNSADLKSYPLELLEILLPLLQQLLKGEIKLYISIPDNTFIALNNVVHHVLEKSQISDPSSNPQNPLPQEQTHQDILVNRSHVMMVLRALNAIPPENLDTNAKLRMKQVKENLVALSFGNTKPINALIKSKKTQHKLCLQIIQNALSAAYNEEIDNQKK